MSHKGTKAQRIIQIMAEAGFPAFKKLPALLPIMIIGAPKLFFLLSLYQ